MNIKWLSIASGFLLLLAIPSWWSYGYYVILRWVIAGTAVFNAFGFSQSKLIGWVWIFGALALLFNPLFPVHLDKSSWVAIDFIAAAIFFLAASSMKKKK